MQFARVLTERLARPAYLYPDELSPHLLRDIGLTDGRMPGPALAALTGGGQSAFIPQRQRAVDARIERGRAEGYP